MNYKISAFRQNIITKMAKEDLHINDIAQYTELYNNKKISAEKYLSLCKTERNTNSQIDNLLKHKDMYYFLHITDTYKANRIAAIIGNFKIVKQQNWVLETKKLEALEVVKKNTQKIINKVTKISKKEQNEALRMSVENLKLQIQKLNLYAQEFETIYFEKWNRGSEGYSLQGSINHWDRVDFAKNTYEMLLNKIEAVFNEIKDKLDNILLNELMELKEQHIVFKLRLIGVGSVYERLTRDKDKLHPETRKKMLERIINLHYNGKSTINPYHLIKENEDEILADEQNRSFYEIQISDIFQNTRSISEIEGMLNTFERYISNEVIINVYNRTNSIQIIQLIRRFINGAGRYRDLTLPQRLDLMNRGVAHEGLAFEIHNFAYGIEAEVLVLMKSYLKNASEGFPNFTINNLQSKFDLLSSSDKCSANKALDRIKSADDYKIKLENALPIIADFLNKNNELWGNDYSEKDSRWKMWLEKSFVESGSAYGVNGVSCVKGIFERLVSGFMSMHPLIDYCFIPNNLIKSVKSNIQNLLRDKKDDVVNRLGEEILSIKITNDEDFMQLLKKAYNDIMLNDIESKINDSLSDMLMRLSNIDNVFKQQLIRFMDTHKLNILHDSKKILKDLIDNIDYMLVDNNRDDYSIPEYIRNQLGMN